MGLDSCANVFGEDPSGFAFVLLGNLVQPAIAFNVLGSVVHKGSVETFALKVRCGCPSGNSGPQS